MTEHMRRLREAVLSRDARHVEVDPDGQVQEVQADSPKRSDRPKGKPTKLAARTFGAADVRRLG